MAQKSNLTVKERKQAVLRVLRREEAVAKIARRYGISVQTLNRWVEAFTENGEEGLKDKRRAGAEQAKIKELERQLAKRDQIIGELTVANRILKKISES